VTGKVVDEAGRPVAGAEARLQVNLYDSKKRFSVNMPYLKPLKTDADGAFKVDYIPPDARVYVTVDAKGRWPVRQDLQPGQEGRDLGNLVLETANQTLKLRFFALDGKPCAGIADLMTGMTVLSFSEDPVAAAKVAEDYAKANDKFVILGGAMGDTILDRAGVKAVSDMPSREELIASIVGCIGAPASNIAGAIGAPASNIASILSTIEEKAEAA